MTKVFHRLPNGQEIVGESPSFCAETEKVPLIAEHDADVLISGETGTGKELFAQAIHYLSPRRKKAFVPVNCGCIPTELVENELFGHKSGAFTSASTSQAGLIHDADGGTLFLDEVATLPLSAQVKLLRFLQEREYRPLGSSQTVRADVRIIAATNTVMEKAIAEGTVRRDLYYRLNIIPIKLPPLRDRLEDIPVLARHFLAKYSARFRKQVSDLSSEAIRILMLHPWPGNVRELEHVIQRAIVLTTKGIIEPSGIVLSELESTKGQESFKEAKSRAVSQFERDYVMKLLAAYNGNISVAAKAAKKNRRAFWELIRRHQIDVQAFRYAKAESKTDN